MYILITGICMHGQYIYMFPSVCDNSNRTLTLHILSCILDYTVLVIECRQHMSVLSHHHMEDTTYHCNLAQQFGSMFED